MTRSTSAYLRPRAHRRARARRTTTSRGCAPSLPGKEGRRSRAAERLLGGHPPRRLRARLPQPGDLLLPRGDLLCCSRCREDQKAQQQLMIVNMDPPDHTRQRSLVNRGFTPRMIGKLHERSRSSATTIVDQALAAGEGDFVTMCAAELPLVVIAELIGVPYEDRHKLFDWSNRMLSGDDPEVVASAGGRASGGDRGLRLRQRAGRRAARAARPTTSSASSSARTRRATCCPSSSSTCSSCC